MNPRATWRDAAGAAAAGLVVAVVPAPLAATLGGAGAGRLVAAGLVVETAYLLAAFACLGAAVPRGTRIARAALLVALPALVSVPALAALTGAVAPLAAAQLPAAATALLGLGAGRAARDLGGRSPAAAGLALLLVTAFGLGLLAVSHLAGVLAPWPRAGELLLSLDPFVAVTAAAGFDLVRTHALYDALTLSGHRFVYPTPLGSSLVLVLAGLALGLRLRRFRASRGLRNTRTQPALSSSREISA